MSKVLATKMKLIEEYKTTISSLSSENALLEKQISDMKTTLNLNQNIFYNFILNSSNKKQEKIDFVNSAKKLWEDNINLLEKKNTMQKNLSILQEISEEMPNKIREELRFYKTKNDKIQEEMNKQKENIIKLQKKLKEIRQNNFYQEARTEVYITSPNKRNVECNQEILIIKEMIIKLMVIHEKKENKAQALKKDLENLIQQVESLKQNYYILNNNIIDMNHIDKNDINQFIKDNIEGYNISADEKEKESDVDEDINDNSEENDEKLNSNKTKNLKKQLEKLKEEYKKMKKECEEYEEIIAKHKIKYKNIEGKLNILKNSIEI